MFFGKLTALFFLPPVNTQRRAQKKAEARKVLRLSISDAKELAGALVYHSFMEDTIGARGGIRERYVAAGYEVIAVCNHFAE